MIYRIPSQTAKAKRANRLDFRHFQQKHEIMIELEVYAKGVRSADKMMGLGLELDTLPGLRYKVDTNHDIVYMEFTAAAPTLTGIQSLFRKVGLEAKFVGQLPSEVSSKKKTQRIEISA
jgi:hypothetical protein